MCTHYIKNKEIIIMRNAEEPNDRIDDGGTDRY